MQRKPVSVGRAVLALVLVGSLAAPAALADPPCGAVEFRFKPGAPNLQIVVWVEDSQGNFVDTPFVTRLTGTFGLGNRPGAALLKTDFGWPYGRREMVAPVWAHRRNHKYPKVVMGGTCAGMTANSPASPCGGGGACAGDCEDSTIAYHSRVSSYEPFYCSPSGASRVDAMSCASKGTFSKGAYLPFPSSFSLYPPRADLNVIDKNTDSPDLSDFPKVNNLVAVSQATPPPGKLLDPALQWFPQNLPAGDYVAWIELSQESDFNPSHNHPNQADSVSNWDFEGHPFLGQPSVVYRLPFKYTNTGYTAVTSSYAGYSTWDGTDGTLHAPDNTISNSPGTGAGRLLDYNDGVDVYRLKVVVGSCMIAPPPDAGPPADDGGGMGGDGGSTQMDGGVIVPICMPPAAPQDLALTPKATSIDVTFAAPAGGPAPSRYSVRYREGDTLITDADFDRAIAAQSVSADAALAVSIPGLQAKTTYAVAVRGVTPCGKAGPVIAASATTQEQKFTTLSGCFVATAAYGSELESHVAALRRFRDRRLLDNAAGQLFVAGYYAFGPSLAGAIAKDEHLRAAARAALAPLVRAVTR